MLPNVDVTRGLLQNYRTVLRVTDRSPLIPCCALHRILAMPLLECRCPQDLSRDCYQSLLPTPLNVYRESLPDLMTAPLPLRPSDNIPDTLLAMPLPTEGNYRKLTAIPVANPACLVLTTRLLLAQLR